MLKMWKNVPNSIPCKYAYVSAGILVVILVAIYRKRKNRFNPDSLQGKRVLITGSSSGIGEQLAYKYSRCGAKIVITGRRADLLEKVATECQRLGAEEVYVVPADVTKTNDRRKLFEEAVKHLQGLDHLILNHGLMKRSVMRANDNYMSELEEMLAINVTSYADLTSKFLPSLEESRGQIAVLSSIAGKIPGPTISQYCCSKYGLIGLFSSLRQELLHRDTGVSVTIAMLGVVGTERGNEVFGAYSRSKPVKPEIAANVIVEAVSKRVCQVVYPRPTKTAIFLAGIFPNFIENAVGKSMMKAELKAK